MPSRSAIAETPVEIWTEIFHFLLYDPVLLRSDPYYPGCKLHTALAEWYDDTHITNYKAQRSILRLVSHSWKNLFDSRFGWFVDHSTEFRRSSVSPSVANTQSSAATSAMWRSARRIHIDTYLSEPLDVCGCDILGYSVRYAAQMYPYDFSTNFTNISQLLSESGSLSAEILILGPLLWAKMCDSFPKAKLGHLFSNIRALEIAPGPGTLTIEAPDFFANLVYLSIRTGGIFKTQQASFPRLTTLLVSLEGGNFETIFNWDLPQLQHLDITIPEAKDGDIRHLFRKDWPHLISLGCDLWNDQFRFEQDIWDTLPRLQYLSICDDIYITNNITSPPDFPLHTISFRTSERGWNKWKESSITELIPYLPNLKTVADYHFWEDFRGCFPSPSDPASENLDMDFASKIENAVEIIKMNLFCASHHLRYEDRWGRTWEEFNSI